MVAEIRQVLAGQDLSYEVVMHKLPYTQAIIKETLRLHPSVPVDFKMAMRDVVLPGGFQMLKGEVVMYMPYVMGRRTDIWGPTARDFNPDRWLEMEHEPSAFKYPAFNVRAPCQTGTALHPPLTTCRIRLVIGCVSASPWRCWKPPWCWRFCTRYGMVASQLPCGGGGGESQP